MTFVPDKRFVSLAEAFDFLNRYAMEPRQQVWLETESGLALPHQAPRYLFRGECGEFETTKAGIHRPDAYKLKDGRLLSDRDLKVLEGLIPDLACRFTEDDYSLDEHSAIGLLQHYGLPTWMVDFTARLGYAFAFAAAGSATVGRVAVMPLRALSKTRGVVDLTDHQWAERPRRQAAFGVITTAELPDLKSEAARSRLDLTWYEFPVSGDDRDYLKAKRDDLVRWSDDPSAGFVRFHITEYVEAHGKFSPELADWLLERIPIAPRCYRIIGFEAEEVVLSHLGASALPNYDEAKEAVRSRRYWSSAYGECSWDRMKGWVWPQEGSITADPRTYHPDS
ncbi:MAG: FRG domain-containing protein [Bryobacteraceae bacterium]|jgi:hypothetical protein